MGTRRMISKDVVRTDLFLDMPTSAQALYFHLVLEADDDGFISNANSIVRTVGTARSDLDFLINNQLILSFPSGVVVIADWGIQNSIRKDRRKPTIYQDLYKQLTVSETGRYCMDEKAVKSTSVTDDSQVSTKWQPNGDKTTAQGKLSKDKLSKDNKDILSGKKAPDQIPYKKIIDYLNEKAKTSYRSGTSSTKTLIKARFKDGFKTEDFITVIDKKVNEWGHDKAMAKYLRPQTLFGNKFESYLNQQDKLDYSGLNTNLQEYNLLDF